MTTTGRPGGTEVLEAVHVLEFAYTRSTGPVIGAFLTGLREARVLGVRASDGRVLVPPQEHDPTTSAALDELVEVATVGTVTAWSWNPEPRPGQPSERPFAWVQVRLDGADTTLLHALLVEDPSAVSTGLRVRILWAADRVGSITDIAGFVPAGEDVEPDQVRAGAAEPVAEVTTPIRIELRYRPGPAETIFLQGTRERRFLGRRCSSCHKVYFPPRGVCSMCGAAFTDEVVEVQQTGTVTTFAVVNVNFASREVDLPYAAVEVLWDGADLTSQFLVLGIAPQDVRMGMRVRAVWREGVDLEPTLSNVTHVEPIDEPDAPFESYAEHV